MSLLPSEPDVDDVEEGDPRVVGLDSDDAEDVISALGSQTARDLLAALHDEPAPPSALADQVDTSLQNTQYHLEKLADAGAIEVVDTAYSAKGREMQVYAPADQPLVIFAGDDDDAGGLRTALSRFLGGLGALAFGSLGIQQLYGGGIGNLVPPYGTGGDAGSGAGPAPAPGNATETPTPEETVSVFSTPTDSAETVTESARTATEEGTRVATETAAGADPATAGLPPGLVFFLGGAFVLAVVAATWYLSER
jgi:DNA-binding transcriptional ArsR family regulator